MTCLPPWGLAASAKVIRPRQAAGLPVNGRMQEDTWAVVVLVEKMAATEGRKRTIGGGREKIGDRRALIGEFE